MSRRLICMALILLHLSVCCIAYPQDEYSVRECIVSTKYVIIIGQESISAVRITDGESQAVPRRAEGTEVLILDEEGVFGFFCKDEAPLLVDFRTGKSQSISIFEKNNHGCDLIVSDSDNVYIFSSRRKGVGFEQPAGKDRLHGKNLSMFSKKSLSKFYESVSEIAATKSYSFEEIPGIPIGGRAVDGKLLLVYLSFNLRTLDHSVRFVTFDGTTFSTSQQSQEFDFN
jgi:hypothetical protein